jgi:hypothetical protein
MIRFGRNSQVKECTSSAPRGASLRQEMICSLLGDLLPMAKAEVLPKSVVGGDTFDRITSRVLST